MVFARGAELMGLTLRPNGIGVNSICQTRSSGTPRGSGEGARWEAGIDRVKCGSFRVDGRTDDVTVNR